MQHCFILCSAPYTKLLAQLLEGYGKHLVGHNQQETSALPSTLPDGLLHRAKE